MSKRLAGKVAIVTGGAQGIGLATVRKFLDEGAAVAVCDVRRDAIDTALESLGANGSASGYVVDVTRRDQIDVMVNAVKERYGRIDVLVNNAGITLDARLQKMRDDQFDKVIAVNLKGTYNCAQAVVDTMVEQGSGVILNASSVVGIYGNFGQTNYAASKFGVIGFVKTWARELGPKGVRCNAVAPGLILGTRFHNTFTTKASAEETIKGIPLGRAGDADDVARAITFLASEYDGFISGATLDINGGIYCA